MTGGSINQLAKANHRGSYMRYTNTQR